MSQLATGGAPILDGRRQPSCGGTSRMTRECQVRICERLGVKFPGPTRHSGKEIAFTRPRSSGGQVIPVVRSEPCKANEFAEGRMSLNFGNGRLDAVGRVVAPEVKNMQGGLELPSDGRS